VGHHTDAGSLDHGEADSHLSLCGFVLTPVIFKMLCYNDAKIKMNKNYVFLESFIKYSQFGGRPIYIKIVLINLTFIKLYFLELN
jgi:hypothetical protein